MESPTEVDLGQRVSLLYSKNSKQPVGTCFNFKRPGLLLTAAHTLDGDTADSLVVYRHPMGTLPVVRIQRHPTLDLAAIRVFPGREEMPCFQIGLLPLGQDYPDAEPVRLYAYNVGTDGIHAHYEFGHIYQHLERDGSGGVSYTRLLEKRLRSHTGCKWQSASNCSCTAPVLRRRASYELTFRAHHGNSGGPVFREKNRHEAVAVITGGVLISRRDSGQETHRAVALPLLSVRPWLEIL